MRILLAGLLMAGGLALSTATASASVCTTYAGPASTTNGATSFPGTFVGNVGFGAGNVCQIGDLSTYNSGSGGAFVNLSHSSSIYEFYWGGGALSITEQIGNNGTAGHPGINVNLDTLALISSTSPSSTVASIAIPFSSGFSDTYFLLNNQTLASGYYAIDTYIASTIDPNFQINFLAASVSSVPEPATIALLALPLLGFGLARRSRSRIRRR